MNRLNQKCVIVSTGLHTLLASLLVFGPAFGTADKKAPPEPPIDFTPIITTDEKVSGGGDPTAKPPPAPVSEPPRQVAKPPPPAPAPPPEPVKQPDPPKPAEVIKEPEPIKANDSERIEVAPKPAAKKVEVDLSRVIVRKNTTKRPDPKVQAEEQAREQARQLANQRRELASRIERTVGRITTDVSGATSMPKLLGPGGGGLPYANFLQGVQHVYQEEWRHWVPKGITKEGIIATASVTIARDGTVLSWTLTRSSRDPEVDRAAQATLNRIRKAVPLPESATESQRTVSIEFEVIPTRSPSFG